MQVFKELKLQISIVLVFILTHKNIARREEQK